MNIIVAVDKNWGIGNQGKLLVNIPDDMRFFRETTTGKVVVMGRKTLESFPGGRPLPNRTNIVLTRNKEFDGMGAIVVHDLEALHRELASFADEDIYVIGGGSVYQQLLPECNVAHVTKIDFAYASDTYFPNLDQNPDWKMTADSEEQTYFDLEYYFCQYERSCSPKKDKDSR